MIGKTGNKNEVYERAIKLLLDSGGNERELATLMVDSEGDDEEWLMYLKNYCEEENRDMDEVLNHVMTVILDSDGEGNIQYKERLDL